MFFRWPFQRQNFVYPAFQHNPCSPYLISHFSEPWIPLCLDPLYVDPILVAMCILPSNFCVLSFQQYIENVLIVVFILGHNKLFTKFRNYAVLFYVIIVRDWHSEAWEKHALQYQFVWPSSVLIRNNAVKVFISVCSWILTLPCDVGKNWVVGSQWNCIVWVKWKWTNAAFLPNRIYKLE